MVIQGTYTDGRKSQITLWGQHSLQMALVDAVVGMVTFVGLWAISQSGWITCIIFIGHWENSQSNGTLCS